MKQGVQTFLGGFIVPCYGFIKIAMALTAVEKMRVYRRMSEEKKQVRETNAQQQRQSRNDSGTK